MRLSAEDRLDLQDLILRYGDAARDMSNNTERLRAIFAEDAVLDGPRGYHVGIEGIIEFAAKERGLPTGDDTSRPYHHTVISNILVDGDGDTATVNATIVQVALVAGDGSRSGRITGTGRYECTAKRIDGEWRLQTRVVRIDGLPQYKDTPEYAAGKRWMRSGAGWVLVD